MQELLVRFWSHVTSEHQMFEIATVIVAALIIWAIKSVLTKYLEIKREKALLLMSIEKERNSAIIEHLKTARSLNRRASDSDFTKEIERRSQHTRADDTKKD